MKDWMGPLIPMD